MDITKIPPNTLRRLYSYVAMCFGDNENRYNLLCAKIDVAFCVLCDAGVLTFCEHLEGSAHFKALAEAVYKEATK